MTHPHLNWFGISSETIAAEYETDAALAEWMNDHSKSTVFPPLSHYFHSAWRAEAELRKADYEWQQQHG